MITKFGIFETKTSNTNLSSDDDILYAIRNDDFIFVKDFITRHKNDLDSYFHQGENLLMYVISGEYNNKFAKMFIDAGIDLEYIAEDLNDYNTLMITIDYVNKEIAEILIQKGVDLTYTNNDGENVLYIAIGRGLEKIIKILLDRGLTIEYDAFEYLLDSFENIDSTDSYAIFLNQVFPKLFNKYMMNKKSKEYNI